MKYFRATTRLMILCGITAVYYSCLLAGMLVVPSPRKRRVWRRRIFGGWARMVARVVGMRITACNAPPAAPFLLVTNHLSYMDIVALEAQVDSVFIAKSEIRSWPIIGLMCRTVDTIFIDRGRKRALASVMDQVERSMAQGSGVVLFAEGTSSSGESVGTFRSSLLEFAVRRRIPVHYAAITYSVPPDETPAGQSVCWWVDVAFPRHVFQLLQLGSFEASIVFGSEPILADDRKVLAHELWKAVNAQFVPVGQARHSS